MSARTTGARKGVGSNQHRDRPPAPTSAPPPVDPASVSIANTDPMAAPVFSEGDFPLGVRQTAELAADARRRIDGGEDAIDVYLDVLERNRLGWHQDESPYSVDWGDTGVTQATLEEFERIQDDVWAAAARTDRDPHGAILDFHDLDSGKPCTGCGVDSH